MKCHLKYSHIDFTLHNLICCTLWSFQYSNNTMPYNTIDSSLRIQCLFFLKLSFIPSFPPTPSVSFLCSSFQYLGRGLFLAFSIFAMLLDQSSEYKRQEMRPGRTISWYASRLTVYLWTFGSCGSRNGSQWYQLQWKPQSFTPTHTKTHMSWLHAQIHGRIFAQKLIDLCIWRAYFSVCWWSYVYTQPCGAYANRLGLNHRSSTHRLDDVHLQLPWEEAATVGLKLTRERSPFARVGIDTLDGAHRSWRTWPGFRIVRNSPQMRSALIRLYTVYATHLYTYIDAYIGGYWQTLLLQYYRASLCATDELRRIWDTLFIREHVWLFVATLGHSDRDSSFGVYWP